VEKGQKEIAALKFIRTGKSLFLTNEELAVECERLIQREGRTSLKKGLQLARLFVTRIDSKSPKELHITAYRALAKYAHMSGLMKEALTAYTEIRRMAGSKDMQLRARVDRALIDVYMYLGDGAKARLSARNALRAFGTLRSKADIAQTKVNYANLLHRQDRHREAEKLYREAAEFFEKSGNETATARCLYNRANTLVQLFDFASAEQLYLRAKSINERAGLMLEATDARYGLAWLRMLEGKFHEALLELSECEKAFKATGDPRGEALCILDRAEVYLGLGLYDDALLASRTAQKLFGGLKLNYEESKAALFLGQAAAILGNEAEAKQAMRLAHSGFEREKNSGFLGVTHLLAADIYSGQEKKRRYEIKSARHLFLKAQLPLWQAVCDLRISSETGLTKEAFARLAKNEAVKTVPHLFTGWQTALGDNKYKSGKRNEALRHWKNAADRLDAVRAQLPPMELRSAYARRFRSPHLRLINAQLDDNPIEAALWSERYKTAGLWTPLGKGLNIQTRRRVESRLAALASQVAYLSHQIPSPGSQRNVSNAMQTNGFSRMTKLLREEIMALEKSNKSMIFSDEKIINAIKHISFRHPIIQFHLSGNDINAFVHNQGNTEVRRFRNGRVRLNDALQKWQFILEGEILSGQGDRSNQIGVERKLWEELGEWLWKPLNIAKDRERVLIIPEGEMANLPWNALIIEGEPLCDRHYIILSPSIRHYLASESLRISSEKVEIFKGKADDLPLMAEELALIIDRAGSRAEVHAPCVRADWPSDGESDLWHYAGHAVMRRDNPFYSWLSLEDGLLFAADFRLKECRVNLVMLAACRSGEQIAMPGEESTGLVRSLLEMGARNVIASHWSVSDAATSLWMKEFYNIYLANKDILKASRAACRIVREKYPSAYYWAAFSVFGAGDTRGSYED
jgi:tetratricopeptide (TPR) repeat protein